MQQKRRLINVPIIHARADFGSIGSKIPFFKEVEEMKTLYWNEIFNYVRNLPLDFSELKVYQDGLPNTSAEIIAKIVDETQTPNYDILRWLKSQKAQIIGTENPRLLLEEYQMLKAIFYTPDGEQKKAALSEYTKASAYLLEERDEYIAQRIKNTLPEGSTGILFIGLAHQVKKLIEQEIDVTEPEKLIGSSSEALQKRLLGKEREL